jgi:hypothetical protein
METYLAFIATGMLSYGVGVFIGWHIRGIK